MILHFEMKQTNNKPYISNHRVLLICDAGVGKFGFSLSYLKAVTDLLTTQAARKHLSSGSILDRYRWRERKEGGRKERQKRMAQIQKNPNQSIS